MTGKTLLITAGVDGDEYAGIEAAYRLMTEFSKKSYRGHLTIIPIVNNPGYQAGLSQNPQDGLYPKYIFPGKLNGKPTERLCWEVSKLASSADFWLDMHGGALTEMLEPFVGSWISGNQEIDSRVRTVINSIAAGYASIEKPISKTKILADHGCGYLLTESGELGKRDEKSIRRHVAWAHQVMSALGMIDEKIASSPKTVFNSITEYGIHHNGIWHPRYSRCTEVKKGEVIGEVYSVTNKLLETLYVKESGKLLWLRIGSPAWRRDVVAGVGII